ncbi:hypothetical protein J6G99_03740 [bacterium]|nr:hypothetical protein [bacterium]
MEQINGIQLKPTIGTDFNSQYGVPDTNLTNNTTLSNNPLYNLFQVIFNGKQTDNISQQLARVADVETRNGGVGLKHLEKKDGLNAIG